MKIIITQWALDSYLELRAQRVFTDKYYKETIRPDVMRLNTYPEDPKFRIGKFWSFAQGRNNERIQNGYKMKWHQVGDGEIQLRLTVGIVEQNVFLCEAYVKKDEKVEARRLAKFKVYLDLIQANCYTERGILK